jgi:hypothetical protein
MRKMAENGKKKTTKGKSKPKTAVAFATWQRRNEVRRLYMQSLSSGEIAKRLGTYRDIILKDIKAIHKEWRENNEKTHDQQIARCLAKLDWLEELAFEAYFGRGKFDDKSPFAGQPMEKFAGDPRLLDLALKVVDRRAKLLGLDMREEGNISRQDSPLVTVVVNSREEAMALENYRVQSIPATALIDQSKDAK